MKPGDRRSAKAFRPTPGLAPLIVAQLIELFTEPRSRGSTLLLSDERARRVLDVADQVVLLELGRILWAGPRPGLQGGVARRDLPGVGAAGRRRDRYKKRE